MIAPRRMALEYTRRGRSLSRSNLREEFVVRELLTEGGRVTGVKGQQKGGSSARLGSRIVIGADGKKSLVARSVGATKYEDVPPQAFYYYAYSPELPVDCLEGHWRHHQFVLAIPTNDGLT